MRAQKATRGLALLVAAGAVACGGELRGADLAPMGFESNGGTAKTRPDVPAAGPEGSVGLTLLEPGAEPRRPLRYDVAAGRTERTHVALLVELVSDSDGGSTAAVSTPVQLLLDFGPSERSGERGARYPIRLYGLGVEDVQGRPVEIERDLLDMFEPLRRTEARVDVTGRGRVRQVDYRTDADASPRALLLLSHLRAAMAPVPVPRREVGVGARWQVTRAVDLALVRARQRIVYTLTQLDGDGGEVVASVQQTAEPQRMKRGVDGTVLAYETSGMGSIAFDRNQLTPVDSWMDLTTRVQATTEAPATGPLHLRVRTVVDAQRFRTVGQSGPDDSGSNGSRAGSIPSGVTSNNASLMR